MRLAVGLLCLVLGTFPSGVWAQQLLAEEGRIVLFTPGRVFVLRDDGISASPSNEEEAKLLRTWMQSQPGRPELAEYLDRAKTNASLQVAKRAVFVVRRGDDSAVVEATPGEGEPITVRLERVAVEEGNQAWRPAAGSEDALTEMGTLLESDAAGIPNSISGRSGGWGGLMQKLDEQPTFFVLSANKRRAYEVRSEVLSESLPTKEAEQKEADPEHRKVQEPPEQAVPWGPLLGGTALGIAIGAAFMGFFRGTTSRLSMAEAHLLAFARQEAPDPNARQRLAEEMIERFRRYPELEGQVEQSQIRTRQLEEYRMFGTDAEAYAEKYNGLVAKMKSIQEAGRRSEAEKASLAKKVQAMEAEIDDLRRQIEAMAAEQARYENDLVKHHSLLTDSVRNLEELHSLLKESP